MIRFYIMTKHWSIKVRFNPTHRIMFDQWLIQSLWLTIKWILNLFSWSHYWLMAYCVMYLEIIVFALLFLLVLSLLGRCPQWIYPSFAGIWFIYWAIFIVYSLLLTVFQFPLHSLYFLFFISHYFFLPPPPPSPHFLFLIYHDPGNLWLQCKSYPNLSSRTIKKTNPS